MPASNGSLTSVSPAARVLSSEDLMETVVSIIADVTRYPRDILVPEANLEEDLGIDSVKRAEILAVLTERLQLPKPEPKEGEEPPAPPRTIGDVVVSVAAYLHNGAAEATPSINSPPAREPGRIAPAVAARAMPDSELARKPVPVPERPAGVANTPDERIIDVIAEVSRYPRELLKLDADLEEDLGFDAEMLAPIYDALRSRFHLTTLAKGSPFPVARTIGDMVAAVHRSVPISGAQENTVAPTLQLNIAPERAPSTSSGKPLQGKVALVTGSGRGLGKAIATHLANQGATVVVNSFHSRQHGENAAAEIVAAGGKAVHLWGSVTNPAHLEQIFKEIDDRFGGVDFLVSNASNGILAPVKEISPDHWDRAFRTNVVGLHQSALLAAASMRRRGGGKIVALSSVGAQRCMDYLACIGTVKAAVESLVRYLAVELGADNIQVNAVSAGPVYGELMEKYPDLEKLRPRCEELTPRKRLNDEQEVAEAVTFLLTNRGMSGTVLLLDAAGTQRISPATS